GLVHAQVGRLEALLEPRQRAPAGAGVEALEQHLQGQGAGHPAVGEAAHAVGDPEQVAVAGGALLVGAAEPDGVLVVLADAAGVGESVALYDRQFHPGPWKGRRPAADRPPRSWTRLTRR